MAKKKDSWHTGYEFGVMVGLCLGLVAGSFLMTVWIYVLQPALISPQDVSQKSFVCQEYRERFSIYCNGIECIGSVNDCLNFNPGKCTIERHEPVCVSWVWQ